jgi:hypothetical protein
MAFKQWSSEHKTTSDDKPKVAPADAQPKSKPETAPPADTATNKS